MGIDPRSELLQKEHGEFSAKMLAKFLKPFEDTSLPVGITKLESLMPKRKTEAFDDFQNPFGIGLGKEANFSGVKSIQG